MRRLGSIIRYLWLTPILGAVGACVLWTLGLISFIVTFSLMSPIQPDGKTDGIVVLTGGPDRINAGLDLYLNHQTPQLLISGVHKSTSVDEIFAQNRRSNPKGLCCLTLGHQATDTVGNARETAGWVREHNIKTLRVITASYHMPRALLEMRRTMPDVELIPHPIKARNFALLSRKGVTLTLSEYHKTILVGTKWVINSLTGEKIPSP